MTTLAPISVGTSLSSLVDLPIPPDDLTWGLQDVSAADAGRVQDAAKTMYKMRTSQKRKLKLSWNNPTLDNVSTILQAFNPEYIFVRYVDPLTGDYSVREFYVGDRSAPFREIRNPLTDTILSTLSFDIIER